MRRALLLPLALSLAALAGGCGGEPGGGDAGASDATVTGTPHARIAWRVRCAGGGACTEDPPSRSVDHDDGQDGFTIACDVTPTGTGDRRFTLEVDSHAGYALRVRSATIGLDGDRIVGTGCRLQIDEAADFPLEGGCTSNPPTADRPCQIQRLDVTTTAGGEPALTGEIRCVAVPARGTSGVTRDVTHPDATSGHAIFELTGCAGL